MSEKNVLLIGFSEICEDVASLEFVLPFNVVRHHKDSNDFINYGLMTNPMRGRTDQYFSI